MNPLRVAVIGAGHLGRIHARIVSGLPYLKLAAVVDTVEASRNEVAAAYGAMPLADYRDALPLVDAAVIATPTRYHYAVARDCIAAGRHVLIEKPLTASTSEARELVDFAQRKSLVMQVGHVERFNPIWPVATSTASEPKYIEAVRRSGFTFRSTDISVVLDLMVHDIDLILSVVRSPVRRVEALGVALFGETEDIANARITFENGCVATLSASRASHTPARRMQLWSMKGFVDVDFATRSARIVRPSDTILSRSLNADSLPAEQKAAMKDRFMAEHLPVEEVTVGQVDAITAEWEDFATSVRNGGTPRVSGRDGLAAVELAELVLQRIAEHAWDGNPEGIVGPHARPAAARLAGPHWNLAPSYPPATLRDAG